MGLCLKPDGRPLLYMVQDLAAEVLILKVVQLLELFGVLLRGVAIDRISWWQMLLFFFFLLMLLSRFDGLRIDIHLAISPGAHANARCNGSLHASTIQDVTLSVWIWHEEREWVRGMAIPIFVILNANILVSDRFLTEVVCLHRYLLLRCVVIL